MEKTINMADQNELHLEPRVARLETGLETLTRNVSEMAVSIRENANNTNQKIDSLVVAVTQAQAPKRTDWGLLISAIGLILALGAAVLIPLNKAAQDNKAQIEAYHTSMVEHQKMDMHPVGLAKVQDLMKSVDETKAELVKRDADLDAKIQKETQLMTDLVTAKLVALDVRLQSEISLKDQFIEQKIQTAKDKYDLFFEKLYGRVATLEELERSRNAKDSDELRALKMQIMTGNLKPCPHGEPLVPTK